MSLTIKPFEQLAAEAITGLIITGGQKGNATNIVKRATTALAVSTAFTDIASGNAAAGVAALQAAVSNSSLDPGVGLAVQGLFGIAAQQLSLASTLNNALPIFGASAEAVATNVAAGVTAAANAEIAKYGTSTSSSTSSSTTTTAPPVTQAPGA